MCSMFPGTIGVIDHMARIGMDGIVRDRESLNNLEMPAAD